jgi:geranylgeranyl reductase family protein
MTRHEVGVIGAGPSGAWAAYLLAARGVKVLLTDHSHPREKPCGGGVTGRATAMVKDALRHDALPAVAIQRARFLDAANGSSGIVPLDTDDLTVTSREVFDARLLASARRQGATFVPSRVLDLSRVKRGFLVHFADGRTCEVDRVIGADGANSLTRRRIAAPFRRDQLSIATGFFARGMTSTEIVIEFVKDPPGYMWSFPRPDHLAIGICAQADAGQTAAALRARTAAWISSSGLVPPNVPLVEYSWPIPTLSAADLRKPTLAGDRWLLVGDAAGLVDPITREGIYFALQSASHAADAIVGGRSAPERDFIERVRDDVLAELVRAARFKARFFQPRFTQLLVDALRQSSRIRLLMADVVAGTQPYRTLHWRLLKTRELGLAWRMMRAGLLPDALSQER